MLVQNGLERNRLRTPTKTALVCAGKRLSYAEVDDAANRLANALLANGIRRGDRVCLYLHNTPEAVIGIYGVLKAGAAFVVINRSVKLEKLQYILSDCGAAAFITDTNALNHRLLDSILDTCCSIKVAIIVDGPAESKKNDRRFLHIETIHRDFSAERPLNHNIDLDLACLVYTSGSTGEPKGVMCDHSNVVFAADAIITYLQNYSSDIVLNVLPLSFDYGLYQLLMTFAFGGTLILEQSFVFPVKVLHTIVSERVTGLPGVPTLFATLLQMDLDPFDLSHIRYITNTAAALHPDHIRRLRTAFPGATLYSMYGLTETKRTLYLPPDQLDVRPGSVGIAIPGTEAWVESPDGERLGPNEVGELVVRGRHVMRGYWKSPEATASRFRPGALPGERVCYTGDLFRADDDGYFYFVGRKDDIIKTRGEKVAPKEVEGVLLEHPGVFAAAVVGVPDPIMGEALKAVLVADPSCVTKSSILAHCRARLEDYMVPHYVEFRDKLPTTDSGKVLKREMISCVES